jgi:hypothetical protein
VKKNGGFAAERGGNERENYFFASWGLRPNLQKNNSRVLKSLSAADFYELSKRIIEIFIKQFVFLLG